MIEYLMMCRNSIKNSELDEKLLFFLAKTNRLDDLRLLLSKEHCANLSEVAFRCTEADLVQALNILREYMNK